MLIDLRAADLFITNPTANVTVTSITLPVSQLTPPSGDGVFDIGRPEGGIAPPSVILIPYGAGSATNTFTMSVYGWRHTLGGNARQEWVPMILASFTCTLCTSPGVAGGDVNASQLFCGTIVMVMGNANISNEVLSPATNDIGHVVVATKGVRLIQVLFGTGSSATSCNALATKV